MIKMGQLLSEGSLWLDDTVNYTYQNRLRMELSLAHPTGSSWTQEYVSRTVRPGPWIPGVSYGANALNEITNATVGYGSQFVIPVTGSATANASNVTVNGSSVTLYADNSFYASMIVTNGPNTFTAIARDTSGDLSTNTSTVNVILTNSFYGYDLNGNLTNDGYKNFAYDDENELIAVWATNAWSNCFAYDGKMRRRIERDYSWSAGTSQWTETNEIHFIYEGNLVVEERNATNVPLVSYTRGLDLSGTLQGAGGIGGLVARTTYGQELPGAPTTAFYHADGNGNVTALMYPNQQLAAKYLYDPFGNLLAMNGPLMNFNKYRFSSKEWNDNSGLYYYLYRFYDPNLQRWLNRDPIGEKGGLNMYAMLNNDSINCGDSFGLMTWSQIYAIKAEMDATLSKQTCCCATGPLIYHITGTSSGDTVTGQVVTRNFKCVDSIIYFWWTCYQSDKEPGQPQSRAQGWSEGGTTFSYTQYPATAGIINWPNNPNSIVMQSAAIAVICARGHKHATILGASDGLVWNWSILAQSWVGPDIEGPGGTVY